MLETLSNLAQVLSSAATPGQLVTLALLGYVIFMITKSKNSTEPEVDEQGRPITLKLLTQNHLHELPQMGKTLDDISKKMDTLIEKQDKTNEGLSYIKGRLNKDE